MFRTKNNFSNYYNTDVIPKNNHNTNTRKAFFSLISAGFLILLSIAFFSNIQTVKADDDVIDTIVDDNDLELSDNGFLNLLNSVLGGTSSKSQSANMEVTEDLITLVSRMFTMQYLNNVELGEAGGGHSWKPDNGLLCDVNHEHAGTPLYHNCDIPNFITEIIQDAAAIIIPTGSLNHELKQARALWGLGVPSAITEAIPTDENARQEKYTGLELFGYNLNYTNYYGEWDHIKVNTGARMLSNFGTVEKIGLGTKAILNGVVSGWGSATSGFSFSFNPFDLGREITNAWARFWGSAAISSIETLLDSSDLNVVNTYSWYRVNYKNTLYNARELTEAEKSVIIIQMLNDYIRSNLPNQPNPPSELEKGQNSPIDKNILFTITEDEEGEEKKEYESFEDWKERHKDNFEAIKYLEDNGVDGNIFACAQTLEEEAAALGEITAENIDSYNSIIETFATCWNNNYSNMVDTYTMSDQIEALDSWQQYIFQSKLAEYQANTENNINHPSRKYVCVDEKGNDLLDGNGELIPYYTDIEGNVDSRCGKIRPPIQNALFGNGYLKGTQETPQKDTRYMNGDLSIAQFILEVNPGFNFLINMVMSLTGFITQISNTLINLSFSPILETLGLDNIIVSLIKSFRDSVFYPLSIMFIVFGALTSFIKSSKNKDYSGQFVNLGITIVIFIMSIMLLYKPERLLNLVDEVPATIEAAVASTIFTTGTSFDTLCSTSNHTNNGTGELDINLDNIKEISDQSSRLLMCENWKAFVFTPWVYGQFGVDYANLETTKMNNTNGDLVGDASVNMGNNQIINNWAIYQLKTTTTGTINSVDNSRQAGSVDLNYYRLIDLQAGPNNGAASDATYYDDWANTTLLKSFNRSFITLLSVVVSIFGLVSIGFYALAKIKVTFLATILLVLLPIILLIGLTPAKGRMKLKGYAGNILALMIERVMLVVLLAVQLRVMSAVYASSNSYLINSMLVILICVIFIKYREDLIGLITRTIERAGSLGEDFTNNPGQTINGLLPRSLQNKTASWSAQGKSMAVGVGTAAIMSKSLYGFEQNLKSLGYGMELERSRVERAERRAGLGTMLSSYRVAANEKQEVKKRIVEDYKDNEKLDFRESIDDFTKNLSREKNYEDVNIHDIASVDSGLKTLGKMRGIHNKKSRKVSKLKSKQELLKKVNIDREDITSDRIRKEINKRDAAVAGLTSNTSNIIRELRADNNKPLNNSDKRKILESQRKELEDMKKKREFLNSMENNDENRRENE